MPLLSPPIRKACVKKLALPSPTPKRPNYSFWMNQQVACLDPLSSAELSQLVRKVAAQGATVLRVSHDLFRVKETADRVGIFKNGEVKKIVNAKDVTAIDLELIYQGIVD